MTSFFYTGKEYYTTTLNLTPNDEETIRTPITLQPQPSITAPQPPSLPLPYALSTASPLVPFTHTRRHQY